MAIRRKIYQAWAYITHLFTAWNTGGEGIHSPYLFYLVRMLIYDENSFYAWRDIERERRRLLLSDESVDVQDFGTGASTPGETYRRRVRDIARDSLEQARVAQILFRLVNYVGHVVQRPLHIVELGTSLGITTAYLAKADSRNHVTTYEGSDALLQQARTVWKNLDIRGIEVVEGNIDKTLLPSRDARTRDNIKGEDTTIDIAFLDANHTREATLRYYHTLQQHASEQSIFVIDDIHHSPEMTEAWREICAQKEVTTSMDMFYFGLIFFDKHYLKRHYKLRI